MNKYLEFDPTDIEDEIYNTLDENIRLNLSNPKIIKAINEIRIRRA